MLKGEQGLSSRIGKNGLKKRVYDFIVVDRKPLLTLFDPGARRSYISRRAVAKLGLKADRVKSPLSVGLGGRGHLLKSYVGIEGTIHSKPLILHPYVIDEIGKNEEGEPIDILFGIMAMEEYCIELDIERKRLDLKYFPKEFTEF